MDERRKSKQQLLEEIARSAEAASRLASIVESSEDANIGKTPEGIITDWSPAAERLYGYSADEVKGKSVSIAKGTRKQEGLGEDRWHRNQRGCSSWSSILR